MDYKTFERFQDRASNAGVLFYYTGPFDSDIVAVMSNQIKEKLKQESASGPATRKLFSTFIEMAQNVLHYGGAEATDGGGTTAKPGTIVLGKTAVSADAAYWIACGNLVESDHVLRVKEKLESLRNMSTAEIKAAYRAQLANDAHESMDALSKGAGLGLLTIARDSTQPIEFDFIPDPESEGRFSYFHIKTVI